MTKAQIVSTVKAENWDFISLSTKNYSGATKNFTGSKGVVGVCFSMHEAYVLTDEIGVLEACDLKNCIQNKENDMCDAYQEGMTILAFTIEDEDPVATANLEAFEQFGLNSEEIVAEVSRLVEVVSKLDIKIDLV